MISGLKVTGQEAQVCVQMTLFIMSVSRDLQMLWGWMVSQAHRMALNPILHSNKNKPLNVFCQRNQLCPNQTKQNKTQKARDGGAQCASVGLVLLNCQAPQSPTLEDRVRGTAYRRGAREQA